MTIIQTKACRVINDIPFPESPSTFFQFMNILNVSDLYTLKLLIYIYKTIHHDHNNHHLNLYTTSPACIHKKYSILRYNKSKKQFPINHKGVKTLERHSEWNRIINVITIIWIYPQTTSCIFQAFRRYWLYYLHPLTDCNIWLVSSDVQYASLTL